MQIVHSLSAKNFFQKQNNPKNHASIFVLYCISAKCRKWMVYRRQVIPKNVWHKKSMPQVGIDKRQNPLPVFSGAGYPPQRLIIYRLHIQKIKSSSISKRDICLALFLREGFFVHPKKKALELSDFYIRLSYIVMNE